MNSILKMKYFVVKLDDSININDLINNLEDKKKHCGNILSIEEIAVDILNSRVGEQ